MDCDSYLNVIIIAGYKSKDQQLIELQDSGARTQMQIQEEADLRALQEQEQSIRQLEVINFFNLFESILNTYLIFC